ncbi:MAG: MinD/ParA family protein [Candidatus Cloacimonetes bacterium]|nr:MinD/ParA family protein [Candidatus Cloacimonadota bacterium]
MSPRTIAVTSGKGGVGKTTFACNLASCLSEMGQRVLLVDADLGLGNVCISMGIDTEFSIEDLFFEGKTLEDISIPYSDNLLLVPGGSGVGSLTTLNEAEKKDLIDSLLYYGNEYDYVIFDTGAGISENVLCFLDVVQEVFIVTTPEPPAMADAYGLLKVLDDNNNLAKISLVANRCLNTLEARGAENKLRLAVKRFLKRELRFLGYIYQDSNVLKASREQKLVCAQYAKSKAAVNFMNLARQLQGLGPLKGSVSVADRFMNLVHG